MSGLGFGEVRIRRNRYPGSPSHHFRGRRLGRSQSFCHLCVVPRGSILLYVLLIGCCVLGLPLSGLRRPRALRSASSGSWTTIRIDERVSRSNKEAGERERKRCAHDVVCNYSREQKVSSANYCKLRSLAPEFADGES